MARERNRGRRGFDAAEIMPYDPDFTTDEFFSWLHEVIGIYSEDLQAEQRNLIDDICDGIQPRLYEVDMLTLKLCDLCKLKYDAKAFTARSGLMRANNYLNHKLNRRTRSVEDI